MNHLLTWNLQPGKSSKNPIQNIRSSWTKQDSLKATFLSLSSILILHVSELLLLVLNIIRQINYTYCRELASTSWSRDLSSFGDYDYDSLTAEAQTAFEAFIDTSWLKTMSKKGYNIVGYSAQANDSSGAL